MRHIPPHYGSPVPCSHSSVLFGESGDPLLGECQDCGKQIRQTYELSSVHFSNDRAVLNTLLDDLAVNLESLAAAIRKARLALE